jgi:hypothetical protein
MLMPAPAYTIKTLRALRTGASVLGHGKWTVLVHARDPHGRAIAGRVVWIAPDGVGVLDETNAQVETVQASWIHQADVT